MQGPINHTLAMAPRTFNPFGDKRMSCNDSCCYLSTNRTICFADFNFTEFANLSYYAPWELGVRYTSAALIMLIAFFGNLAIIIILLKNRILLRTSVNYFILNMSVADLMTSMAGPIPFTIRDTNTMWVLGEAWCYLEGYIQMLVMLVSVTSLATISFDRMVGVVYPFHKHLGSRGARILILTFWILSAIMALPFGVYRVYTVRRWNDLTEKVCGEKRDYLRVWWLVAIIALNWLPLLIMLISYTMIFIYFYKMTSINMRREHPAILHLKKRVVRMMFAVVMVFLVCWLPFQILKLNENQYMDDTGHLIADKQYQTLLTVAHYMIYINTALNPVIYGLMHQTFKRAFRVTFTCFYSKKASFVLRKSRGASRYVWSMTSTNDTVYANNMNRNRRRNLRDRLRRTPQLTPQALVCTPALAASIALQKSFSSEEDSEAKEEVGMVRLKGPKSRDPEDPSDRLDNFVNEGFVRDLPPRRISVASTGALGHLVTQVIEEESSSDVDASERIL